LNRPALALIVGAPGAGKTILASQILFHVGRQGLQTLVFTAFSEGNDQYIAHLRTLEFFEPTLPGDTLKLFTLQSQLSAESQSPAGTIVQTIRSTGAKLVLIDGFQGAAPLLPEGQSVRALLAALAVQLRYLDATLLLTIAGDAHDPQLGAGLTVADVVISLAYTIQGRRHQRLLEVVKQRGRAQLAGLTSCMAQISQASICSKSQPSRGCGSTSPIPHWRCSATMWWSCNSTRLTASYAGCWRFCACA
jgi:circadian clock protein KaiC